METREIEDVIISTRMTYADGHKETMNLPLGKVIVRWNGCVEDCVRELLIKGIGSL